MRKIPPVLPLSRSPALPLSRSPTLPLSHSPLPTPHYFATALIKAPPKLTAPSTGVIVRRG
jgi:hypothetical protein